MSDDRIDSLVSGLVVIDDQRWILCIPSELLFWKSNLDDLHELDAEREALAGGYWDILDNWAYHARDLLETKRRVIAEAPNPELALVVLSPPVTTCEDFEEYLRALVLVGDVAVELKDPEYFIRLEGRAAQLLVGERLEKYAELGSFVPVSVLTRAQLEGVIAKYL